MDDGGAQGPIAEAHSVKPRCSSYRTLRAQQDCGPHQKSFFRGVVCRAPSENMYDPIRSAGW